MMENVNFVVLKINDVAIGQLPHQQQKTALNMLLNEDTENIVLELKRKSCWRANKPINYDDIEISKKLCYLKLHHNSSKLENSAENNSTTTVPSLATSEIILNLHLPPSSIQEYYMGKSTQTEDIAFYVHEHLRNIQKDTERLIEQEHNLFEQSLAPEIDIEEITLRKSVSNERLGITVCYSHSDDYSESVGSNIDGELYQESAITEVYISDIHPDSVAGRDGRLRQGDQILQINGKDIKTRPETETLIAENNNAVTLLVSRYLYANDDDFNDPSTNEDDDDVLVVEDDEDEDDEDDDDEDDDDEDNDDEDDELYEGNNMTYVNCMINNDCCVNASDELDKVLMSQLVQDEQGQQSEKLKENLNSNFTSNPAYQFNIINCTSDFQKDPNSKDDKRFSTLSSSIKCGKNIGIKSNIPKTDPYRSAKPHDVYETEHIYETIPEDTESEPFYCSPYDSSVYVTAVTSCSPSSLTDAIQHLHQKQRVAQWLGIKPLQEMCTTTASRQSVRNNNSERSAAFLIKSANGTVHSAVTSLTNGSVDCILTNIPLPANCQLEDQDNSSSAYNTGGSNNSVSPLTLMLNPKNRCEPNHLAASSTSNPQSNGINDNGFGLQRSHPRISVQQKTHSPKDKSKTTSPKGGTLHKKITTVSHNAVMEIQIQSGISDRNASSNKESNVNRNILLKQHLLNQKLSLEKSLQPHAFPKRPQLYYQQQPDQTQCPQFTAPNLSQYHFVSSQEVNNLSLNNKMPKPSTEVSATISNNTQKEEDKMVWKVKRRPDGTRYIVRRPAKNRVMKERNTRLNVERLRHEVTTTEDDTISEIKTGRYWTREERRKHIEKARERRHQQQLFQQQQNKIQTVHDNLSAATLYIGDVANKILKDPNERAKTKTKQYLNIIRQHPTPATQQEHCQLQFNSAGNHKLSSSLQNMESPIKNSSSTLPNASEEHSVNTNADELDVLSTVICTPEHNQITNSL